MDGMREVGYEISMQLIDGGDIEETMRRNLARSDDDISCYYTESYQRRWLLEAVKSTSKVTVGTGATRSRPFKPSETKATPEDDPIYSAGFVIGETVQSAYRKLTGKDLGVPQKETMSSGDTPSSSDSKSIDDTFSGLFDVDDTPVEIKGVTATAFDPSPRTFPFASAFMRGIRIDRFEFDRLVNSFQPAALRINWEALPGAKLYNEYITVCGAPPPWELSYAVSTAKITADERDKLIQQAIDSKTPIKGYDLLTPGDPAIN
jgi:hypothetical protein